MRCIFGYGGLGLIKVDYGGERERERERWEIGSALRRNSAPEAMNRVDLGLGFQIGKEEGWVKRRVQPSKKPQIGISVKFANRS